MRSKKARRGSTLVMVAIMLVAFVGVGAIASDIGRYYVVTGEIQTAADAAALAGALKLQNTLGTTATVEPTVDAEVIAFVAATNRADNTSLSVTHENVQMGIWTPGTNGAQGTLTSSPSSVRPNAVTVTLAGAPKGVFAQLLGQMAGVAMQRQGTAWIANLGSNCVRPMNFPYLSLYKSVSGNTSAVDPAPNLDPNQFSTWLDGSNASRTFVMIGDNQTTGTTPANDGEWTGYSFVGNAGKQGFTDGLQGCTSPKLDPDAANGVTLPGNANYATWAADAVIGKGPGNQTGPKLCNQRTGDAGCYQDAAFDTLGVTINAAWGDLLTNGSNGIDYRYVGEFQMVCFYQTDTDQCPAASKLGWPNTGYPVGTVMGYMKQLKSRYITPDDVFGNLQSNVQRIVLVK